MRITLALFTAFIGFSALSGCKPGDATPETQTSAIRPGQESYLVTEYAPLRLQPTEDDIAQLPVIGGAAPNFVMFIPEGKSLRVLEMRPGWVRVAIDREGADGWLPEKVIIPQKDVIRQATVLVDQAALAKPDAQAPVATYIPKAQIVFVLEEGDPFARVRFQGHPDVWMATAALSSKPNDLAMAELFNEAKHAAESGRDEEAGEAFDEARARFPEHRFIDAMAELVNVKDFKAVPGVATHRYVHME